jgi:hypothetical protein
MRDLVSTSCLSLSNGGVARGLTALSMIALRDYSWFMSNKGDAALQFVAREVLVDGGVGRGAGSAAGSSSTAVKGRRGSGGSFGNDLRIASLQVRAAGRDAAVHALLRGVRFDTMYVCVSDCASASASVSVPVPVSASVCRSWW